MLGINAAPDEYSSKPGALGVGAALMIVSGFSGEVVITRGLTPRRLGCFVSTLFFLCSVYELLIGLTAATASEPNGLTRKLQARSRLPMSGRSALGAPTCRAFVPHARHQRCIRGCVHPVGLLRVGHQLHVWCGQCGLPLES